MLKICRNCHEEFETTTTRFFCQKPACEKARKKYIKEAAKASHVKWREGVYEVYRDAKLKGKQPKTKMQTLRKNYH